MLKITSLPTITTGQVFLARLSGKGLAHHLSFAQHRHPIAYVHDLVQLMADDDHHMAGASHLAQGPEEVLGLLGGEHGGGFVQNQQIGIIDERLEDFHPLLFTGRQLPHLTIRIDVEAEFFRKGANAPRHPAVGKPEGRIHVSQGDVFCNRMVLHQHKMLMHHTDAPSNGIHRGGDFHRLAIDADLPAVRLVQPVQDVHEGGLPGTVLPQQAEDLTARDLQVDLAVGRVAVKGLADVHHLECFDFPHRSPGRNRRAASERKTKGSTPRRAPLCL
jgi:hypothetical protein